MTFTIQTYENFVWFRFLTRLYLDCHSGSKIFDFFKNILWFIFLMLYNKAINDCSLGKQSVLFPLNLRIFLDLGIVLLSLGTSNIILVPREVRTILVLNFWE